MRAAVYYNNRDVRIEERERPAIRSGELLVRMRASGICGSDVMEWYRIKRAPLILGHEMCGEVAESADERYPVGTRLFAAHHVPCNRCHYCLHGDHTVCETLQTTNFDPGGFAEYIRIPALNVEGGVLKLPEDVSFDAGTFIEPLGCVLRGQRLAGVTADRSVLILGAGLSGLLHLLLARQSRAAPVVVTDVNEYRLSAGRALGADHAVDARSSLPELLRRTNGGRLADVVIVCTGALPAFQQALECVDRAGTILFFAPSPPGIRLPIPVNDFWRQSVRLVHSYGSSPADSAAALELIRSRAFPVEKLITHRLRLADAAQGFRLVAEARECIKVILYP